MNAGWPMGRTPASIQFLVVLETGFCAVSALINAGVPMFALFNVPAQESVPPVALANLLGAVLLSVVSFGVFSHQSWSKKAVVQGNLILCAGTLLAMTMEAMGRLPRTVFNDLSHVLMLALVVGTLLSLFLLYDSRRLQRLPDGFFR